MGLSGFRAPLSAPARALRVWGSKRRSLPTAGVHLPELGGAWLLCRRAVDIGLECRDELVLRPDAGHRDQQRLVGKAGFEREVVAGEDVTGIVGAPVKEVVIVEVEQLVRQAVAVRRLPQIDV